MSSGQLVSIDIFLLAVHEEASRFQLLNSTNVLLHNLFIRLSEMQQQKSRKFCSVGDERKIQIHLDHHFPNVPRIHGMTLQIC